MTTNLMNKAGIAFFAIVTLIMTSCVGSGPRRVHVPGAMPPPGFHQPQPGGFSESSPHVSPSSTGDLRLDGARGYMKIVGTEKLSPIDPTPDAYRSILSGKRFIRDSDGVISESVLRTIANGGVIGWSGHDFGFEPTVQEVTGVTDRISVTEVARACIKYRKLPSPQSASGRLVRERVLQLERQRGYTLR